ncbi:hypothetical protein B0J18DRAFT_474650 [Chaetomium sp. MPI-SDFR-AT-0129]|nr:hypothetical protein B0J18DRAFT_474650 [Chaetomium sp. MPI-SDFR-AT-0129]
MGFTGLPGTALGPLTTTWTMPDSCTVHVLNCPTCDGGFRGQQCVSTDGRGAPQDHTTCWPPTTSLAGTPRYPFVGWGFYSPGLACPAGYTTACTAQYGGRSGWDIEFTLIPGETAIGCCPEGFECANRNGNTCIASRTPLTVTTALCSGTNLVSVSPVTVPLLVDVTATTTDSSDGALATGTTVYVGEVSLLAPMYQLNFQQSDLESASSASAASSRSSAGLTRETGVTGASQSSQGTSSSGGNSGSGQSHSGTDTGVPATSSDGLSTGAIAGIAVGAALGGILLGVLALLMILRKRKKAKAAMNPAELDVTEGGAGAGAGAGIPLTGGDYKYLATPTSGTTPSPYPPPNARELDSAASAVEVPGGYAYPPRWAAEMPTGQEIHEFPGQYGGTELHGHEYQSTRYS